MVSSIRLLLANSRMTWARIFLRVSASYLEALWSKLTNVSGIMEVKVTGSGGDILASVLVERQIRSQNEAVWVLGGHLKVLRRGERQEAECG